MSHAGGQVLFPDGEIMFFEYDGTSDIYIPTLFRTPEELNAAWRKGHWGKCHCGKTPEEVQIYTSYGGGWTVPGTACRKCLALSPIPDYDEVFDKRVDGSPAWDFYGKPKFQEPLNLLEKS